LKEKRRERLTTNERMSEPVSPGEKTRRLMFYKRFMEKETQKKEGAGNYAYSSICPK